MRDDHDYVRRGFYGTIGAVLALYVTRFVATLLSYLLGLVIFLLVGIAILLHHFGVF
ncbi:hypothetical protein [Roseomonas indoligenes]|uniref:Uncharacterized protein n=1 Tax=Roseomonas indoligenes TaxID=2820811 RepID=A0A940N6I3_9PROT|nr:hypothetical protein [Pararoseomonas indoligenes]MBP0496025.1 hypothetical protein [Pararoseomonas indoligenes]